MTFLYGNFDNDNLSPKLDIFLRASPWSAIVILDVDTIKSRELTFLGSINPTISMCLSNT